MPPPGGTPSDLTRRPTRHVTPPLLNASTSPLSTPPRRAQTRKINPVTTSGAQCYPRLACPLDVSLFMQVQRESRPAPALALNAINKYPNRMQSNAPDSCAAIFDTNSEKLAPKRPAKTHYSPLLSALRSSSTCCCINPMVLILLFFPCKKSA